MSMTTPIDRTRNHIPKMTGATKHPTVTNPVVAMNSCPSCRVKPCLKQKNRVTDMARKTPIAAHRSRHQVTTVKKITQQPETK